MEDIPDGVDVVIVLGEIDCREGVLVAVEKLKYEVGEKCSLLLCVAEHVLWVGM